jgi:hypothetical protein
MRLSTILSISTALASASAQYLNQTGPFNLQLVSADEKYDGVYLAACHEGAAIESLCPLNTTALKTPNFYYNFSDTPSFTSTSGYLTYLLTGSNFQVYEPMSLFVNPSSNVAVPLFTPGDSNLQLIAFDSSDLLYIPGGIDDTQNPINPQAERQNYYRWYVCTTYEGYMYETVAWTLGEAPPQNPTCCKVDIKKVSV